MGFPGGSVVNNPPANAGDVGSISGSGRSLGEGNATHFLAWEIQRIEEPCPRTEDPLEKEMQHAFLPEKSQGKKSLAGYSPWDSKELDMT